MPSDELSAVKVKQPLRPTLNLIFQRALQNMGGTLSYIADERTGMQWATLGKSGSKTDSESIFQQQFGEYHGVTVVIHYILTATQSFGSQDYCERSRMTILEHPGVLSYKNELP